MLCAGDVLLQKAQAPRVDNAGNESIVILFRSGIIEGLAEKD
jgi:hypothetical protein